MVKLDPTLLRFFEDEDFRVLTALEMATRNHEVAPTVLIERIAQLPHGGARKRLKALLKHKVIHHENTAYDGYAMKYAAFDFLALRTLAKRGSVAGVGCRIGCGKESDIFLIEDEHHNEAVLKLQRLGRCSFRSVARNRDYKNGKARRGASWFYLSRLAATKEFAFMKMLYDEGFPVPKPIDHNRHAVVMEYVKGNLLNHVTAMSIKDAQKVYNRCVNLVVKLAQHGLIHGDFNEFNAFVTDDFHIILIDFPQMISTDHQNAAEMFDRDIQNLAAFFERRFRVPELLYPKLTTDVERIGELDRQVQASGAFSHRDQQALESMMLTNEEDEADSDSDDGEIESGKPVVSFKGAEGMYSAAPDELEGEASDRSGDEAEEEAPAKRSRKPGATKSGPNTVEGEEVSAGDQEEEEGDEEEEDSEEEGEQQLARRRSERVAHRVNPNFTKGGKINKDHIKARVKASATYHENRAFNKGMHRNMQKGREKESLQRKMKDVKGMSTADVY